MRVSDDLVLENIHLGNAVLAIVFAASLTIWPDEKIDCALQDCFEKEVTKM